MRSLPIAADARRPPIHFMADEPFIVSGAAHSAQSASGGKEFASAFENAAIGMALIGVDFRGFRVNKAFCRMLGYTEAEMLASPPGGITHPDDLAEDIRLRDLCLAGVHDGYQREKRYLHKDGRVVWGHLTCTLVRANEGVPAHFVTQAQDITERKLAEQALRRSEERFRSLLMLSSDWYWEQDEQFRFKNFSGTRQAGPWRADQADFIGLRRWDLSGVVPLNMSWEEHRAVLESHQPFTDFQYMRQHGTEPARYLSTSGEPVFDEDGRFTGYRGTARDTTAARLAEQNLRETQALLHMAAQIGRLGAWAWELGQQRMYWSPEVCAIHEVKAGYSPSTEEVLSFIAPEDHELLRGAFRACLRHGTPFDVEARVATAKGRMIWVRVLGEADWDDDRKVRRLQGACQDISEARQAAENARLMAGQLSATLESLTDAFFTVDRQWRFTYVNAEAERLLRRPRAQLLGREIWEELPHLEQSESLVHYARAMTDRVTVQFDHFYAPFSIWVHVKLYPSEQGLAIFIRDVTERMAAQREILRLNAELEERVKQRTAQLEVANKELEAFSYSIAHDLRAPLSSIDGFSQMLEQAVGEGLGQRCRHYLSRIRAGVRQMGDLTDGLLSLANLSRASMRSEAVDLAVMARAALSSCREAAPERAVDVAVAPALPAMGDPRLLSQVMGNLVGNAWKFTARTERARIEVGSTRANDGSPVYYVRDNGAF